MGQLSQQLTPEQQNLMFQQMLWQQQQLQQMQQMLLWQQQQYAAQNPGVQIGAAGMMPMAMNPMMPYAQQSGVQPGATSGQFMFMPY